MRRSSFSIIPLAPYSFHHTVARLGRMEDEIVDRVVGREYRRLLRVGRQLTLATVRDTGTTANPKLSVRLISPSKVPIKRSHISDQLRHILSTDIGLKPFYQLARKDSLLKEPIASFRGLQVPCSPTVFEALVVAVLAQQVNLKFAYSIKKQLVETFGKRWKFESKTYYTFPDPVEFWKEPEENLRSFRLSAAKAGTLKRLGQAFSSGVLSERRLKDLPDEAVIEKLTQIKGIGRWSAETALLRGLKRYDAFPAGDLGVVKYLAQGLLGKKSKATEAEMRTFAERWRPYRGLALSYCYVELARRKKLRSN